MSAPLYLSFRGCARYLGFGPGRLLQIRAAAEKQGHPFPAGRVVPGLVGKRWNRSEVRRWSEEAFAVMGESRKGAAA